jgi:hypothetical protein
MVLPLAVAGLGMMGAGTAAQLYGTNQRDRATQNAMGDYQAALAQKLAADRAALTQQSRAAYGLQTQGLAGLGDYISEMSTPQAPDQGAGFMSRVGASMNEAAQAAPQGGSPLYQGAPFQSAMGQQEGILAGLRERLGTRMLSDYRSRQESEKAQQAASRKKIGDLLLAAKGGDMQSRFQLSDALRQLDWAKQEQALQSQLDAAQRKGQWANMLGGLGTQAGGMLTLAGLAGGGQAGSPNFGSGGYNINSPGALDLPATSTQV